MTETEMDALLEALVLHDRIHTGDCIPTDLGCAEVFGIWSCPWDTCMLAEVRAMRPLVVSV